MMMPTIVSDTQTTFVKDRSLIHNVLICQDILGHYGRKTTARFLMKIDLRKGYDMGNIGTSLMKCWKGLGSQRK